MARTLPKTTAVTLLISLLMLAVACETSVEYPRVGAVYVLDRLVSDRQAVRAKPWPLKAVRIDNIVDGVLLVKYSSGWEKFHDVDLHYVENCRCFESTRATLLRHEDEEIVAIDATVRIQHRTPNEIAVSWSADGDSEGPFRYLLSYIARVDLSTHRHPDYGDGFGLFGPLESERDRQDASVRMRTPGTKFRDRLRSGVMGPEMVVIPAGRFHMGALSSDRLLTDQERPVREVVIENPFALSVDELTFEHYDRFTRPEVVGDGGWGRVGRPVMGVSWRDARHYAEWLSTETGEDYRLPTEAEWEYAARAGTTTLFSWGDELGRDRANCGSCGSRWDQRTAPVGWFTANTFGLFDMHGNVAEWVQDCWNRGYVGAPSDGTAWLQGDCDKRVLRGGSWFSPLGTHRSASRNYAPRGSRFDHVGIRVARTLADDA